MPKKEPLYPHVPKSKEPQFPHRTGGEKYVRFKSGPHIDSIISVESWEREKKGHLQRGEVPPEVEYLSEKGKPQSLPQTTEKLYQRAADGYPIGADKIMRDAWGPIPNPDQPFWSREGFIKPVKIYGWQWSPDYHSWRAYVRFPDGTETWTSPREQTGGSLELLASTEGDPIRKFCCRQCGECAPKELLEEGRFPDRIAWLRNHYKEKHPSTWGKVGRVPQTEKLAPPQTTKKPTRDDVTVESWQERDRLGIWITDKRTDKTFAEWWDEDARQMFEDGFFKPGVPRYAAEKPGREFVESVLDYAESVGMLAKA